MANAGDSDTDAMRSVYIPLKIAEHPATSGNQSYTPARRLTVLGYEWQINYHPSGYYEGSPDHGWVKLCLSLVGSASAGAADHVTASFTCRLVDPTPRQRLKPSKEVTTSSKFWQGRSKEVPLMTRSLLAASGYLDDAGNCVVQCAVVVLFHNAAPNGDLLMKSQEGTDVTFVVAGESFHAHRCVLAARSPVFKAELLGGMAEKTARIVEIEEMDADAFRPLLHYDGIYLPN